MTVQVRFDKGALGAYTLACDLGDGRMSVGAYNDIIINADAADLLAWLEASLREVNAVLAKDAAISKVEGMLAARHTATCCDPQPRKDLVFARDVQTGDTIVFHGAPETVRSINLFNDGVRDWCEFGFQVPADASALWQVPADNAVTKLTAIPENETKAARDGLAAAKAQVAS